MTTDTNDTDISNESPLPTLHYFEITTDEILNGFCSLKANKSPGPDITYPKLPKK